MFTPGPRATDTPPARASRAMACPTVRNVSGSQDDASPDAVGKQVAGTLPPMPT